MNTQSTTNAPRIIAVANQKGGVGKTTTAVNLAACLAESKKNVLLIDMDPQGNATSGLGIDRDSLEFSTYQLLLNQDLDDNSRDQIIKTDTEHLFVIASIPDLAAAEVELVDQPNREFQLQKGLQTFNLSDYDFVVLDCPPSLGLITINALVAANEVLIPVQTEYYALEGMGQLLKTLHLVRQHLNPQLAINGIVLTMYDGRTNLSEQVASEVRQHFEGLLYESVIPRNIRLSEAPSYGESILQYDRGSRGAKAYQALATEFIARQCL